MTSEEFQIFYQWSVDHQANELMEACQISREVALEEAKAEVAQMLPHGLHTDHHYFMTIEDNHKEPAGFIWTLHEFTEGKKQSFLCDFMIVESKRRQGYATTALTLMEKNAAEAGCRECVLFVADRNHAARALYKKCGYQFLRQINNGCYMIKQLSK